MTKRILKMFLLLALAVGFYAMTATAKGDGGAPDPTSTARSDAPSPIAKPETCKVYTSIDGGTVNLRTCEGMSCAVVDIVTEGESLNIVKAGLSTGYASLWTQVTTADGVTGWLNNKYCKKESKP